MILLHGLSKYSFPRVPESTAQKMKLSIKWSILFRSFLPIWSHLLKKSSMEYFIFCVVRPFSRLIKLAEIKNLLIEKQGSFGILFVTVTEEIHNGKLHFLCSDLFHFRSIYCTQFVCLMIFNRVVPLILLPKTLFWNKMILLVSSSLNFVELVRWLIFGIQFNFKTLPKPYQYILLLIMSHQPPHLGDEGSQESRIYPEKLFDFSAIYGLICVSN